VLAKLDAATFGGLPENLGRARGFATPTAPTATAMPEAAFTAGATSPEVEAVQAEIVAGLKVPQFGPVYEEFANDPEGAIAKLMAEKQGEVRNAFASPENPVANITLLYGDESHGLRHIQDKHPEMIARLPDLLRKGRVVTDAAGLPRLYLVDDADPANVAVLRLDYDGFEKTWLVSAFEDYQGKFARQVRTSNGPPASASPRVPDATGPRQDTPDAPADQGLTPTTDPLLDQAAVDAFDAQAVIAAARAGGDDFAITMPDGTTMTLREALDDLDADAAADFQITFCTTNEGAA
jgi:hypothetical protein